MKLVFNGNHERVSNCVDFINSLFDLDMFYMSISDRKEPFTHCHKDYSPDRVSRILKTDSSLIVIRIYKPKNPFSSANAYVSPKYKNTLFLNSRRLDREIQDIINTIVHECVHVSDYNDNGQIDFGHGTNESLGKENSAPYWIGGKAKQFYLDSLEDTIDIDEIEIDESLILEM